MSSVASVVCLSAFLLMLPAYTFAQLPDFSVTATQFSPDAIPPGGTSSSDISVQAVNGFVGTVDLSCQVSSAQRATSMPACTVSPSTVVVPGDASATITTLGTTSTVGYNITITGTGPSTTHTTPPLNLTVLSLTPQFTVTVETNVSPGSVTAGNSGTATLSINPIYGYTSPHGGVILACSSITPLGIFPPYCSFSYSGGAPGAVVNGTPATATLTIKTWGPTLSAGNTRVPRFYVLWLPVPMLILAGFGAATSGKRARKAWGMLALFVASGALLLIPACGNTVPSAALVNGNALTPNNTYTFTIIGVDSAGVVSTNSSGTSSVPTVTLTVTSPPK